MRRGELPCRGCTYSAFVLDVVPQIRGSNYSNVTREFIIYCNKKRQRIKYYYKQCAERKEKQWNRTLDAMKPC